MEATGQSLPLCVGGAVRVRRLEPPPSRAAPLTPPPRVIEINLLMDPARVADISEGADPVAVEFTYSVKWVPTTIAYEDRLQRYERFPLNPIHLEVCVFCVCVCVTCFIT